MIHRLVKMTFQPGSRSDFISFFDKNKHQIEHFDGCMEVRLLTDESDPNVFFTYSIWEDQSDLEAYRQSPFFKNTWSYVKGLFSEKAQAWSTRLHIADAK